MVGDVELDRAAVRADARARPRRRRARGRCRRGSRAPARASSRRPRPLRPGRRRRRSAGRARRRGASNRAATSARSCRAETCSSRIGSRPSSARATRRRSSASRVRRSVSSAAERSAASSSSRERGWRSAISSSVFSSASGVRSSWLASSTNRRSCSRADCRRPSISLSVSASRESSSRVGGTGRRFSGVEAPIAAARRRIASTGRSAAAATGVPGEDREQERRRPAEHELAHEPVQRLLAGLERLRDDDRAAAAADLGRDGEHPPVVRESGDRAAPPDGASREHAAQRPSGEDRTERPRGRLHDDPARVDELRDGGAVGVVAVDTGCGRARSARSPPAPARGASGRPSPGAQRRRARR